MSVDVEKIVYDKKIVLYGLGTKTERLINQWNGKHERRVILMMLQVPMSLTGSLEK